MTVVMKDEKEQLRALLTGVGRSLRASAAAVEEELRAQGLDATYSPSERHRFSGRDDLIHHPGSFHLHVEGVGWVFVAPEGFVRRGGAEIEVQSTQEEEARRVRDQLFTGRVEEEKPRAPLPPGVDGLERVEPSPVGALFVDPYAGTLSAAGDPKLKVKVKVSREGELPAPEGKMTAFVREVIFRALGLREVE